MAFGSRPWLLPAAVLLGVLLAAGIATLFGGLHRPPTPAAPKPAPAIVVESAPCARSGARDTVLFVVEGRSYRLPMDACGNPEGIHIEVELAFDTSGAPVVSLAGTRPTPRAEDADRLGTLLLALSSLACALLTVHTSPTLRHARAVRRRLSAARARATTAARSRAGFRTRASTGKLITGVVPPGPSDEQHNDRDHPAEEAGVPAAPEMAS